MLYARGAASIDATGPVLYFPRIVRISHASRTDVGMKRDNNEDNLLVFPEQHLFAVFDGMGGHAAGEVASSIAAREMKDFFELTGKDPETTWPFKDERSRSYEENRLVTAIKLCNARIIEASEQDAAKKNMGTTCVALNLVSREGKARALVAHAGDSRAYLFRDDRLRRLTVDHSLVEEYVRLGRITEDEARSFPQRNIILRALGQQRQLEVEIRADEPRPGDLFLLCSDGLSGMVEDASLESILRKHSEKLEACAKKLVDTANDNGGVDNTTVVLARFEGA